MTDAPADDLAEAMRLAANAARALGVLLPDAYAFALIIVPTTDAGHEQARILSTVAPDELALALRTTADAVDASTATRQ